jgi:hypothetical protein
MNRLYREIRKKYRLATLKEMKISTKRVLRVELDKIQMQETKSILAMPFCLYIEQEIAKALESENYKRAKELNLLKNR